MGSGSKHCKIWVPTKVPVLRFSPGTGSLLVPDPVPQFFLNNRVFEGF